MPLRWRLIALYGAILVAVLAFFAVGLAYRLRTSLVEALDRELDTRVRSLAGEIEIDGERWFVEDAGFLHDYRADAGRYFVAGDAAGAVSLRSPFASSFGVAQAPAAGVRDVALGGETFRELTIDVERSPDDAASGPAVVRIACGGSLRGVDAAISSIVTQLWIVGPLVLVLAMAGGLLLVSRALRPVRAALERERRFTADASHELRTPLAVIAGNVELAQARERPAAELQELFAEVAAATSRMRAIVDGLLLFARAEAGVPTIVRQRVDLAAIADETVRMQRPLAEARGVTVACENGSEVVLHGDPERLRQLVTNLVDNGIRYNRRGGTVTVRVGCDERGRAELVVDDTGIGMRAQDLPRVFERFFRADPARARAADGGAGSEGTGLGLAIAKWIVQAHGGEITVTSTEGRGSRFAVTLPRDA